MTARRFPPPWTAEDHLACFIVKDSTGQALAHIYYEVEPGGARPPSCSARMRRDGSQRTSPSCRSCCANKNGPDSRRGQAGGYRLERVYEE